MATAITFATVIKTVILLQAILIYWLFKNPNFHFSQMVVGIFSTEKYDELLKFSFLKPSFVKGKSNFKGVVSLLY